MKQVDKVVYFLFSGTYEKNAQRLPPLRQHNFVIKNLQPLFLFLQAVAYTFIHRNMPAALPCLQTVQRIIFEEYRCITEGEFDLTN